MMKNGYDMIYLAACGLHDSIPEKAVMDGMDLLAVYKQACRHSMQAVTYTAVAKHLSAHPDAKSTIDPELLAGWQKAKAKAVRNNILFETECEKICAFMEQQNIWYMPLKGAVLQKYYAKLGIRQMCDVDILFDAAHRKTLYEYMLQNGYQADKFNTGYPDAYRKPPAYYFEMHFSLYTDEKQNSVFYEYYKDVKNRLHKDENNACGYHFSEEDFYIFCTAHAYKHFSGAGNGIRSLMDVYVYLSKAGERLDRGYVDAELDKLGMRSFEEMTRKLAYQIFSAPCAELNGSLTEEEQEILAYYLGSGTYGTAQNSVIKRLNKLSDKEKVGFSAKVKYCFSRLFPDMDYYKINHPFFYRHKVLIPAFLVYRAAKRLTVKQKGFWAELKTIRKMK